MTADRHTVALTLNGTQIERTVDGRLLLSDFVRHDLEFTGTHVGCEHGVCGSCTVLVDGHPARSCLMLAVQADGHAIETVEGLAPDAATLSPLQAALRTARGARPPSRSPMRLQLGELLPTLRILYSTRSRRILASRESLNSVG